MGTRAFHLEITKEEQKYFIKGDPRNDETVLPLVFRSAQGSILKDVNGNRYLDFAFGLNVSCGHGHPAITKRASRIFGSIANAGNYTTLSRMMLARAIIRVLGDKYGALQFYSSGTEAVEAGLWFMRKISRCEKIVSFYGGYHGKTHGSISLSSMKKWHGPRMNGIIRVPYPHCYRCPYKLNPDSCQMQCIEEMNRILRSRKNIAGLVIEPIQGQSVAIPPKGYLKALKQSCNDNNLVLMADEILTGLGRTGLVSVCAYEGVQPDIMTLGKSLGNGMPISVVIVNNENKQAVEEIVGTSTYGGNPLSTSIAFETLKVITEHKLFRHASRIGKLIRKTLFSLTDNPKIGDIRGRGCLWGIEFVKNKKYKKPDIEFCSKIAREIVKNGVIIARNDNVIRLTPALNIPEEEALSGVNAVVETIKKGI